MLFPKTNDIFMTSDDILLAVGPNSYAFSVHRPALQKRQEYFWASRTYLWYKQWFAYSDLECYFLKMTFVNTLDDITVMHLSFLVQS